MSSGEMALSSIDHLAEPVALERGLLDRCRLGESDAFASLVALHERMVFNLAARLLGDPEEARDVAQDVFLQVHKTLHRFEGRSRLKTWIYRIVVNQCHNRRRLWRRRRRDRFVRLEDLRPRDQARLVSEEDGPDRELARQERTERLQEALLALPFSHRAVLLLREVEGLPCDEIARTLRVPSGTVKSRLARAREALRRKLLETGGKGAPT